MARQKQRGNGEGSIFQRKDGRWCGVVTTGRDAKGRLKRRYVYRNTRTEVKDALTKLLADQQKGLPIDPPRQTVAEFLVSWVEDAVKGTSAPNTYNNYRHIIHQHLVPAIGALQMAKLSPQHLQRLYREKQDAGYTRTVRLCHAVLHRALGQAAKWGLVARNVAALVDAPRVARTEMQALFQEEAMKLLDASQEDRLHAMYVLAVTCGPRQGELLGLKWEDVDLQAATVQIRRQLQWIDGEPKRTELKTTKSRRTVMLPSMAVTALKKHRARQAEERLKLGEIWQDWGLVFCTTLGTPISKSTMIRRSFHPLLEKAGLPKIRFHDLRHTAATLLLAAGENPKVVAEMLGHSTVNMTLNVYAHVTPTMQKQAAARMDAILTAAPHNSRHS